MSHNLRETTTLRYEAISKLLCTGQPFAIDKIGKQLGSGPSILYAIKNAGYLEPVGDSGKFRLLPEYAEKLTPDHIRELRNRYNRDLKERRGNADLFTPRRQRKPRTSGPRKRRGRPEMAIVQQLPLSISSSLDAFVSDYIRIKQLVGELYKLTNIA